MVVGGWTRFSLAGLSKADCEETPKRDRVGLGRGAGCGSDCDLVLKEPFDQNPKIQLWLSEATSLEEPGPKILEVVEGRRRMRRAVPGREDQFLDVNEKVPIDITQGIEPTKTPVLVNVHQISYHQVLEFLIDDN